MEEHSMPSVYIGTASQDMDDAFIKARGSVYKIVVETVERPLIEKALSKTFGNQLKAAKLLGINRNTLRSKIKKLGIEVGKWKF